MEVTTLVDTDNSCETEMSQLLYNDLFPTTVVVTVL